MKVIMRDGVKLDYHCYGQGQPIILLHGFGSIQEVWIGQIHWLVEHGYEVITYDQRNHGDSQLITPAPRMVDLIQDLHDLIQQLNLRNPFLVGHSMGAAVIYGFLGFYPDLKIKGAIAVDQPPRMLSNQEWPYGYLDVKDDNYQKKLFERRTIHETLHGFDNTVWKQFYPVKQRKPIRIKENLQLLVSEALSDWRSALIHTNVHTLLVSSIQSPFFNYRYAEIMQQLNPYYLHVKTIYGAGHDVQAEVPLEFNSIMGRFLSDPVDF